MLERPIVLSSRGLERAASARERSFVVRGNGWEYECTEFEAVFISPRVDLQLQEDETINSMFIDLTSEGVAGRETNLWLF
jgi:hypothetical protein